MKTRIGILGARGRMGRAIAGIIQDKEAQRAELAAQVGRGDPTGPLLETDVIIDVSTPEALLAFYHDQHGPVPPLVSGVTGWQAEQRETLENLAQIHPILLAANFSLGIALLHQLLRQAAPLLRQLGYTPVVTETHHRHKKDAPSGTALSLCRAIAPENPQAVQVHAIRAGEVYGDHAVTFYGDADQITLSHHTQSRDLFAAGAVAVALWFAGHSSTGKLQDLKAYLHSVCPMGVIPLHSFQDSSGKVVQTGTPGSIESKITNRE